MVVLRTMFCRDQTGSPSMQVRIYVYEEAGVSGSADASRDAAALRASIHQPRFFIRAWMSGERENEHGCRLFGSTEKRVSLLGHRVAESNSPCSCSTVCLNSPTNLEDQPSISGCLWLLLSEPVFVRLQ